METICVSVFMLTYNQEKYIAQAIKGVLMQETSFSFQLVIGDDNSTDGTREICKGFAGDYPDKIKLILNEENIGIGANYVKTYAECTGRYVAICDGDDFWTDPQKLQKQVDFLKKNPLYKIVYTNHVSLYPTGEKTGPKQQKRKTTTSFEDIVFGNYITSVTVLFENVSLTEQMQEWLLAFPYGDWPTYLLITANGGKIGYIDVSTAVYRRNLGTSTALRTRKSRTGEINLAILKNILRDKKFKGRAEVIKKAILELKTGLMGSYNKEGKYAKSFYLLVRLSLEKNPLLIARRYTYSLRRKFTLGAGV